MSVHTEINEGVVIVSIEGRFLGMADNNNFRTVINDDLSRGFTNFVLDFSGIEWIDSAGIGSIIAAQISIGKKGGNLRLASLTERVAYYFDICNLDAIFIRYDTVAEAIESFKP